MDCAAIRHAIVESVDDPPSATLRAAIDAHVAACAGCARFRVALTRVDDGLSRQLSPPRLAPGFRPRLRAAIAAEPRRAWSDWMPAAVHFASCGAATAVCAVLVPSHAGAVVLAAAAITFASHFLLNAAQGALDAAGDPSL